MFIVLGVSIITVAVMMLTDVVALCLFFCVFVIYLLFSWSATCSVYCLPIANLSIKYISPPVKMPVYNELKQNDENRAGIAGVKDIKEHDVFCAHLQLCY